MSRKLTLHPDRLFPAEERTRSIARGLYQSVRDIPIVSPHGHTDPAWFATNEPFANPAELLIILDHYLLRMLYSQGVPLEHLGVPPAQPDRREAWRCFAENYQLFRGTPSRMWLDWVFAEIFGLDVRLSAETADIYYDTIYAALRTADFRPRALFDRFNIEVLATTDGAADSLEHPATIVRQRDVQALRDERVV